MRYEFDSAVNVDVGLSLGGNAAHSCTMAGCIRRAHDDRHARYTSDFEPITECGFAEQLANGWGASPSSTSSGSVISTDFADLQSTVAEVAANVLLGGEHDGSDGRV